MRLFPVFQNIFEFLRQAYWRKKSILGRKKKKEIIGIKQPILLKSLVFLFQYLEKTKKAFQNTLNLPTAVF